MGWFSKIERPWVSRSSIWLWKKFSDLDLTEARKTEFRSLHDCFTRELKPNARVIDRTQTVICSPCDGIVGACGQVEGTKVFQAKGFPYELADLLGSHELAERYRDGTYVTIRLTATMYHRFHAPDDCTVKHLTYISGDTWNVNPIALARIERLFCKNERAAIHLQLQRTGDTLLLVPVAAILVASIRVHFLPIRLHLRYRGANEISCCAGLRRGQEMGWFEHGSTILVFAPKGYSLGRDIAQGTRLKMGQALLTYPEGHQSRSNQ